MGISICNNSKNKEAVSVIQKTIERATEQQLWFLGTYEGKNIAKSVRNSSLLLQIIIIGARTVTDFLDQNPGAARGKDRY
jgi:ABC-type enterobactin transport system permease subunit